MEFVKSTVLRWSKLKFHKTPVFPSFYKLKGLIIHLTIGVATRGAKGTRAPYSYFRGGLAPPLLKIDIL